MLFMVVMSKKIYFAAEGVMSGIFKADMDNIKRAGTIINGGGLVAFPTETVYGLGASVYDRHAVAAIFEAKGRPAFNPLISHISIPEMLGEYAAADSRAEYLAKKFWPGPLTLILWGNGALPSIVPAGGATQGVRCPDHPDTLAVIRALGRPLACPSANLSGGPSPRSAGEALGQLAGKIDAVLDGGPCAVGVESAILDLTAAPYRILREGGLSRENIEAVLGPGKLENN